MTRSRALAVAVLLSSLSLSGCALPSKPVSILPPPSALADQTKLDERALIALELSYKAARVTVEEAADAGLVTPALAARLKPLNRNVNKVLERARSAYDAANASGFEGALAELAPLVNQLWLAAAEGKGVGK